MIKVLIKKLSPEVKLPSYKTSGASGMDLMAFISSPIIVKPNSSQLVPTGISLAFSEPSCKIPSKCFWSFNNLLISFEIGSILSTNKFVSFSLKIEKFFPLNSLIDLSILWFDKL